MEFGSGDATLAAIILANQLIGKPITEKVASYTKSNPDPASFRREGFITGETNRIHMNNTFEDMVKRVNPKFNPAKQMQEAEISPSYPNYPGAMSRNSNVDPETFTIKYGKGVDKAVYAHELGHILAQNTPGARQVNDLRKMLQHNPKLSDAIDKGLNILPEGVAKSVSKSVQPYALFKGSRYLAPMVAAGMTEGDDDLATSLALSVAMSAPILADEGIASMNALKIMKEAGTPATGKQKRRLAAAWGNYLAPALIAGMSGNVVGNLMD